MIALRLAALALVLSASAFSGASASPPDPVRVTMVAGRPGTIPADTGVYHCTLIMGRLWERSRAQSDERIARSISVNSQLSDKVQVLLGIHDIDQTHFAEVTSSIERLTRLINENAREGCPVEIIVFPVYSPADPEDGA